MRRTSRIAVLFGIITLVLILQGASTPKATAAPGYTYLPTSNVADGRMLSLAGTGLFTLGGQVVDFEFQVPSSTSSFEIGVFDGDTGKDSTGSTADYNNGHWDYGTDQLQYTLYTDPFGDGTGPTTGAQVAQWLGNDPISLPATYGSGKTLTPSGPTMPDNDWQFSVFNQFPMD